MRHFSASPFGSKLQAAFLFFISVLTVCGAAGDVDPGFDPRLTIDLTNNYLGNVVFQPDGKMIVFGSYNSSKPFIQRLNPDGSPDPTFYCPACRMLTPRSVVVLTDGKILVGGEKLIRINPDGSLDAAFSAATGTSLPACTVANMIVQPDGRILTHCQISSQPPQEFIRRLNSDGSFDSSFSPVMFETSPERWQYLMKMILLPDGRILAGGGFTGISSPQGWLRRFNTDGTTDNSFQVTVSSEVTGIGLLPDGKYLISGNFSTVNGATRNDVARLLPDGTLDSGFFVNLEPNESGKELRVLPNGQFYLRIQQHPLRSDLIQRFARYNDNGALDGTFGQTFLYPSGFWEVDSSNRIVTFRSRFGFSYGYHRLNIDGTVDAAFTPTTISGFGFATVAAIQNDQKIIIAGNFGKVDGFAAGKIARLNADGTPDTTFITGTGFNTEPSILAIQPDGKILAGGTFTSYNGTPRTGLARLNADGTLDTAFSPTVDLSVLDIEPLANDKILIGGNFTTVNGISQRAFARLNGDGSLDTSFAPVFNAPATVNLIFVQAGGKFFAGGTFNGVSGFNRSNLVRFNADGSVDPTFTRTFTNPVNQILPRPNGQYIVSTYNPNVVSFNSSIFLINNDGTTDFAFNSPNSDGSAMFSQLFQQPDGNIIFGGRFNWINNRFVSNIARIGPRGQMDNFFPSTGTNGSVSGILGQSDGKILFVGNFSSIEGVSRPGIARLTLSSRRSSTFFDFDGDARSDISVFRPSTNIWYELLSANWSVNVRGFGDNGDIPAPADYDGDGKTDLGVFRPSNGHWLFLRSSDNTVTEINWGLAGDIPRPSDVDADGRADLVVYRPSTGTWFRFIGGFVDFGAPGDQPLIADFDGDGRADPTIFRPSSGDWWYAASTAAWQHRFVHWGQTGDIPAPADYDGDGITDFVVFRPSNGSWYVLYGNVQSYTILNFGMEGDKPVPADYDGDGKTDFAVWRPSTGTWYLLQSTAGFGAIQWGVATDVPLPNAFLP